jgi:hypothetical protein
MVDFKREEQKLTEENASFERGYDQAVQEVLDEVQERAPELVKLIRQKYATWHEIMRRRDG